MERFNDPKNIKYNSKVRLSIKPYGLYLYLGKEEMPFKDVKKAAVEYDKDADQIVLYECGFGIRLTEVSANARTINRTSLKDWLKDLGAATEEEYYGEYDKEKEILIFKRSD